jgi:hypothetical protein
MVMKSTILWDITPCSPLKVSRHFGGTYRLHLQSRRISRGRNQHQVAPTFTLVSCSAYSSTLKMEAICSSETSVYFQRTTRRYIPDDSTLPYCSSPGISCATNRWIAIRLLRKTSIGKLILRKRQRTLTGYFQSAYIIILSPRSAPSSRWNW